MLFESFESFGQSFESFESFGGLPANPVWTRNLKVSQSFGKVLKVLGEWPAKLLNSGLCFPVLCSSWGNAPPPCMSTPLDVDRVLDTQLLES